MYSDDADVAGGHPRRLFVFNGGFWVRPRLRRIVELAGWNVTLGLPGHQDFVGVWGASPTAWRGQHIARVRSARLIRIEDAFLRSVLPGRAAGPVAKRGPIGLLIDPLGVHFDPSQPSLIETLIKSPEAAALEGSAKDGIDRLRRADLSKYNRHSANEVPPPPGYVLVIDQTRGDASLMGAGRAQFLAMLDAARAENPGRRIVLRVHPETSAGLRPGHFTAADLRPGEAICDADLSPWRLLDNADRVYVMSSQIGYEALLAGHRPRIFGQPFYAGWGLSDDEGGAFSARRGTATALQLFAASHLLAPCWYDPCRDQRTDFNGAVDQIEAETKAYRQDRQGHVAYGIRLWKRPHFQRFFGTVKPLRFTNTPSDQVTLCWANKSAEVPGAILVEDGFLRSRGLGADLTPPLSLIADDLGIYYDPRTPSRLETLIARDRSAQEKQRALDLIGTLRLLRVTKYNVSAKTVELPTSGKRILVPGQVGDDASMIFGSGPEKDNLTLLQRVRRENPDSFIIYKPHPDVEAGLRPGEIDAASLADLVASGANTADLLDMVDEVWTITSTLGFEALLRSIPVTTLGAPFYAGWGLTRDLGPVPQRRSARPDLASLAYACLIAYPRYRDPVSDLPCPAEIAAERLADPRTPRGGPALRSLAKLQGALAGQSWIWRR